MDLAQCIQSFQHLLVVLHQALLISFCIIIIAPNEQDKTKHHHQY